MWRRSAGPLDPAEGGRAAGLQAARALANPHTLAHALALVCRFHAMLGGTALLHQATEELAAVNRVGDLLDLMETKLAARDDAS